MTATRTRQPPPPLLWRCDRCNRHTKPEWLTFDGLGLVCPPCRIGAAIARNEVVG